MEERKSRDKNKNADGKEIIEWMTENGVGIVNGSVVGDKDGNYTYVGARGITVIDYVLRNGRDEMEESMEIREVVWSDHLQLLYEWGEKLGEEKRGRRRYRKIHRENKRSRRKERVERSKGAGFGGVAKKEDEKKEEKSKWFDKECRDKRVELIH